MFHPTPFSSCGGLSLGIGAGLSPSSGSASGSKEALPAPIFTMGTAAANQNHSGP